MQFVMKEISNNKLEIIMPTIDIEGFSPRPKTKSRRFPNRISISPGNRGAGYPDIIYTVCDDGSIWRKVLSSSFQTEWENLEFPTE
jgi:hypothetical protein